MSENFNTTYGDNLDPSTAAEPAAAPVDIVPAVPRTPLESAQDVVQAQYIAAQDREDAARNALADAEDHHAACTNELNLLEDAHKALFPEKPNQPADNPTPPAPPAPAAATRR